MRKRMSLLVLLDYELVVFSVGKKVEPSSIHTSMI